MRYSDGAVKVPALGGPGRGSALIWAERCHLHTLVHTNPWPLLPTCPVSHGEAAHVSVSHGMAGCVGTYGYSVSSPGTRGLWLEFLKQLISD